MLSRLVQHNDRYTPFIGDFSLLCSIPLLAVNLTRFHSRAPPRYYLHYLCGEITASISISDYIKRIVKYASIEKSTLLLVLIYIDRMCELHKTFTVSSLTIHRCVLALFYFNPDD
jgi:hypothetical protein